MRAAIAAGLGAVIVGGAVWWGVGQKKTVPPPPAQISAATSPPAAAPAQSIPVAPPAASVPVSPPATMPPAVVQPPASSPSSSSAGPSTSGPAEIVPPAPPAKVYDARKALAEVYAARNRGHTVAVTVERAKVNFNRGESIGFSVSSSKPGFVYVLEVGVEAGGKASLLLLFPNAVDRNNRIGADAAMSLPRASWPLVAGGPAGTDHFLVIVSDSERDFTGLGMRMVGREGYGEFPRGTAAQLYRTYTGATPLFAGKAKCPADGQTCSDAYGAAEFTIEEVAR